MKYILESDMLAKRALLNTSLMESNVTQIYKLT